MTSTPRAHLRLEVDQSGKIETAQDTILAYSNNTGRYAICIPGQVKREILTHLRQQGKSKTRAVIWVFSVGLFFLLRDVLARVSWITIDLEYEGHEADIKSMLMRLARQNGLRIDPDVVTFAAIGKSSGAHEQAIGVFRGQFKADRIITLAEFSALSRG
ncbi:MAG: hypothetical protein AUK03_09475 [Anaerolineae bacterium CG2_30_64_16]|nr:MAG: hypothetical protein AUK03_09475 [Anaerolineae bacterium CG2_30_64_16]